MRLLAKTLKLFVLVAALPVLAYLLLLGASHVYTSSSSLESMLRVNDLPVWTFIDSLNLPGIGKPSFIHVPTLEAVHVFRNLTFVFCVSALVALFVPVVLIVAIGLLLFGLFTASWGDIGTGLLLAVGTALLVIAAAIFPFVLWITFFFQPSTPAYVLLWAVLGLPFGAILGLGAGAAPTSLMIVIIIKT